jgi:cell wall-associated NlpC family hydrolase
VLRTAAVALLAALALAPAALAAGGYAEVVGPAGNVVAAGTGSSFDYPSGGGLVHIGHASVAADGVVLDDVSLLGGQVQVASLVLPRNGSGIQLDALTLGGAELPSTANQLVPLGGVGYMVVAQQAVATNGAVGRVGLRVSLQQAVGGVRAGTQLLIGLPYSPSPKRSAASARRAFSPLAVLGFPTGAAAAATGFVAAPSLGIDPLAAAAGGTLGQRAVALAEQFLGVPYTWGGADPLGGFDCSGLAMYVYAQLGVQLTHYTGAQFNEGMPVPPDELQPGDLVFFDRTALGPQHEGIYIGDGEFIQAPHTGDVVRISRLDGPRYGLRFVGAVRPYLP